MSLTHALSGADEREPLLWAKGISRLYRGAQGASPRGLHPLDVWVGAGEVVGLIGPNGAGKSTAFELLAGQRRVAQGEVWLCGHRVERLPLWRRARLGLGYLAQRGALIEGVSVREHLSLAISASRRHGREVASEVSSEELLTLTGLGAVATQQVSALSGGERQRLALGSLMALQPRVILLDEPFAALDPRSLEAIRSLIFMIKRQGVGVLLTDHQAEQTLQTCERVYVLDEGQLITLGTPSEVRAHPLVQANYLGAHSPTDLPSR